VYLNEAAICTQFQRENVPLSAGNLYPNAGNLYLFAGNLYLNMALTRCFYAIFFGRKQVQNRFKTKL